MQVHYWTVKDHTADFLSSVVDCSSSVPLAVIMLTVSGELGRSLLVLSDCFILSLHFLNVRVIKSRPNSINCSSDSRVQPSHIPNAAPTRQTWR